MLTNSIQRSSCQIQIVPIPPDEGSIPKIAIHMIRAVGFLLMATGIGCIVAVGLQVPPIALLVAGAVALILGFAVDRKGEVDLPAPAAAFGKEEWIQHIGDPGDVPPLPANIDDILAQPCPFWEGKTVAQTHMLILIPKTVTRIVNGETVTALFTLRILGDLVQSSNRVAPESLLSDCVAPQILHVHGDTPVTKSRWILMTKDVLPRSRNKNYFVQQRLVEAAGYEIPSCLEAATAILLEYVRSGIRCFANSPNILTRCQEIFWRRHPSQVGYFAPFPNRLEIILGNIDQASERYGMAGLKRL